ncbi:MT-A70 family methyltransferase [Bradyrhizobium sp. PUT101]|uniref:MT-A70 family methyltransferase n=1 Tax=Bradyrhizobium sp. PUT101 TaxID=3447427 RepID=UPI003F8781FF
MIPAEGGEQILDGRNRYRALCWLVSTGEVLGDAWGKWSGEPLTVDRLSNLDDFGLYCDAPVENDAEALTFVLSKNLNRRHLTDDQRRMLGARLVNMRPGRQAQTSQSANISREQAAELVTADVAGIDRARAVVARAVPEVVAAVDDGALSVAAGAEIAKQPVERQAEIAKALTRDASGKLTDEAKRALAPLIREIRVEKIAAKKERRAEREQEFGRKVQALPGSFYGVAIEDFEWHHAAWSEASGSEKSPSMHYETAEDAQTPEAIVARCAERFACLAPDCVLFKWVTIPHLAIGIKVLELQGFEYVTSLVWNKERAGAARGPGYWVTGEHEIVLVGKRGNVVPPATAHFRSNFSAPVGAHSEKPDNLHELVEFHWPNVPKVEFNARRRRDGWAAWGFDAPDAEPTADVEALREAFNAARAARAAERLWEHPAVDGSHVVSMTRDYTADASFVVATCRCGWSFRCVGKPFDLDREAAVDAHWREVIARAEISVDDALPEPSGEAEAAAAEATDGASAAAAVADVEGAPYDAADVVTIDQLAGSEWLAPSDLDALELPEHEQLKILSDFCHPRRALCAVLGPHWQAREMAYLASGQWALRGAGWDRLRELEAAEAAPPLPDAVLTEPYCAPQMSFFDVARQIDDAPPAEVVDGALQTRLPVDADELAEQLALLDIAAGRWDAVDSDMIRHLVGGRGFAHCTTTSVLVTDEGRAFLAQLVAPVSPSQPEARQ